MNFNFKKKFGQNFINDKKLLKSIVDFSKITENDFAVEVGAGSGNLTEQICEKAKGVFSFEIDDELKEILQEKFNSQKNLKLIFADAMNISNEEINKMVNGEFHLIANLPYYITTPLIFKFLENEKCKSLTIMVQKEVAERIVATEGSKDYGILSVTIGAVAKTKLCKIVPKEMFTPKPKVDSAIIHIEKTEKKLDYTSFKNLVQTAFSMRRKTLQNNLTKFYLTKKQFLEICEKLAISPNIRAEQLSIETFKLIFKEVNKLKNIN